MSMHRRNKGPRAVARDRYESWFWPHVRRQRRRFAMQQASRKRNRPRK